MRRCVAALGGFPTMKPMGKKEEEAEGEKA